MQINYYYDLTWKPVTGGDYSFDSESQLVQLCDRCASWTPYGAVAWAAAIGDDEDASCELCQACPDDDEDDEAE